MVVILFFSALVQAYRIWNFFARGAGFALLGMVGVNLATVMAAHQFGYILTRHFCPRCVNFSCPLNRPPEATVEKYLERNPVIKAAWEKSGREPERHEP